MSPFESGCVVLNQGGSPNYGICFKLSPREEVCAPYGQLQWASIDGSGELSRGERLPARLLKLVPYPSDDPYARGRTSCTDCQKRDASLAL